MDLYRQHLLDLHQNPHNFGRLKNPHYQATYSNPFCGDTLTIQLQTTRKPSSSSSPTIKNVKFSGAGCAISRASASLFTDWLQGKTLKECRSLTPHQLLKILNVQLTPTRQKCALVAYQALLKAINPHAQ